VLGHAQEETLNASLKRILVVDDEPSIVDLLTTILSGNGWSVTSALSGADGIEKLERGHFDVILSDIVMPGNSGIDLLMASKELRPDIEVILMTGYATSDTAIEAMRSGAFHYIVKPLMVEEVLNLAEKAYLQRQLRRENQLLRSEIRAGYQIQSVVGDSATINRVITAAQAIAQAENPIFLEGERGSGRNFLARFIHFCGPRAAGMFVPIRCASMSPDQIAPELFGYFPLREDHSAYKAGRIEMANHGTLFLSDIEAASLEALERLANFIDSNSTLPSAENNGKTSPDVRVIVSSSFSLDELQSQGAIPPRLAVLLESGILQVPPLRERKEDVPFLLHHFLQEANNDRKKALKGFTPAALSILEPYDWPGNVRELARFVREIAAKKKQGTMVDASEIPPEIVYRQARKKESP